jgi:hypothetical protein
MTTTNHLFKKTKVFICLLYLVKPVFGFNTKWNKGNGGVFMSCNALTFQWPDLGNTLDANLKADQSTIF